MSLVVPFRIVSHDEQHHNFIRPTKHGSQVVLDPNFLPTYALYLPERETIVRSNMTLGQAIEAIAFAHICFCGRRLLCSN